MLQRLIDNFRISLDAIAHNRLRALLSSLGIVFGIASVISMIAIGRGAKQETLDQLRILGSNNIVIATQDPAEAEQKNQGSTTAQTIGQPKPRRFSPGLTLRDLESIRGLVPFVTECSPEIVASVSAIHNDLKGDVTLTGVTNEFFCIGAGALQSGVLFSPLHYRDAALVCVIGSGVKSRFFAADMPLGKKIKCGGLWYTVIGVIELREGVEKDHKKLGLRNFNNDVYIPLSTMLIRQVNRSPLSSPRPINGRRDEQPLPVDQNYNQIDRVVVKVDRSENIAVTAEIIERMLLRRHNQVEDFSVAVPELLLAQEQKTKRLFNIVLGAIASISLLVGGIGIMNIMLASVMERIKEIGVRLSVGATPADIAMQFLGEAVIISLVGGIIGIVLGVGIAVGIQKIASIQAIVSIPSIIVSFTVSAAVGLCFGYLPARKASSQNPIECIRYE